VTPLLEEKFVKLVHAVTTKGVGIEIELPFPEESWNVASSAVSSNLNHMAGAGSELVCIDPNKSFCRFLNIEEEATIVPIKE
jgi:hypothetical protein